MEKYTFEEIFNIKLELKEMILNGEINIDEDEIELIRKEEPNKVQRDVDEWAENEQAVLEAKKWAEMIESEDTE